MSRPDLTLVREFEAALAWWQAAGVTHEFADDATALLAAAPLDAPLTPQGGERGPPRAAAEPERRPAPRRPLPPPAPTPAAPVRRALLGESPPADLVAFRDWWRQAPELGSVRAFPRIAPSGPAGAALMVLVPQPEEGDRDRLLEGPQGRLLGAILAAIGLAESEVYIASALACHTPLADLGALAAGGMDAVTAHHVALVRPARLLAFGTGLAPMLGAPGEQALREINHAGGTVPVLVSETLDALMDMPRLKARFWRRWMEWSATL